MRSNQRGNAILISAILVFALTVTALGVSRLLIKGTQQMTAQREFLAMQAQALAEAHIRRWARMNVSHSTFVPKPWQLADYPITRAATPGVTTTTGTASVDWTINGTTFAIRATASVWSAIDPTVVVSRMVGATATCPVPGIGPCSAGPYFFSGMM